MNAEGIKFTRIPGDRGLATKMGITIGLMKKLNMDLNHDGYVNDNDVRLVNLDIVEKLYTKYFWNAINADELPAGIDILAADIAFNSGIAKWQEFKKEGNDNDIDIIVDRRIRFYKYQAKNIVNQKQFLKGWINRAEVSRTLAKKLRG